jgi:hypothetical protein
VRIEVQTLYEPGDFIRGLISLAERVSHGGEGDIVRRQTRELETLVVATSLPGDMSRIKGCVLSIWIMVLAIAVAPSAIWARTIM